MEGIPSFTLPSPIVMEFIDECQAIIVRHPVAGVAAVGAGFYDARDHFHSGDFRECGTSAPRVTARPRIRWRFNWRLTGAILGGGEVVVPSGDYLIKCDRSNRTRVRRARATKGRCWEHRILKTTHDAVLGRQWIPASLTMPATPTISASRVLEKSSAMVRSAGGRHPRARSAGRADWKTINCSDVRLE